MIPWCKRIVGWTVVLSTVAVGLGGCHSAGKVRWVDSPAAVNPVALYAPHRVIMHDSHPAWQTGTFRNGELVAGRGLVLAAVPGQEAVYESPVVEPGIAFDEVVLSWNLDVDPLAAYVVELRAGDGRGFWSPYQWIDRSHADWPPDAQRGTCAVTSVDVDTFQSKRPLDRLQYRLRVTGRPGATENAGLHVARVVCCVSPPVTGHRSVDRAGNVRAAALPVPFRTQTTAQPDLAGRICSPTSVAMVLDYHGAGAATLDVANVIYDPHHELYGNWPRAAQAAYHFGVPAYVARLGDWQQVQWFINRNQPVIISVTVKAGELPTAPYKQTSGHLLVVTGFDEAGNVRVNDPAASTPATGQQVYSRAGLTKVWLERKRGTCYILEPRPADEPFVDLADWAPDVVRDVRYATTNNFTGEQLYPEPFCRLRRSVADRIARVQRKLGVVDLGLKIYDGYRPLSVQRQMWTVMPDPRYVADPARGSRHNRGAAVDVTLIDRSGAELAMATAYDDFTSAAHRDYRGGSPPSRLHRALLAEVMASEGFTGLDSEWWHFDAPLWQRYPIADE